MQKISIALFSIFTLVAISCTERKESYISEENFLKADSALWTEYERNVSLIFTALEKCPEKKDSLELEWQKATEEAIARNVELALEYSTVPSALHRVYMVRKRIDKSRLQSVLAELPDSLKDALPAKYIRNYIDSRQLAEGYKYVEFDCQTASGEKYDWKKVRNSDLLLLYGGLDCMGESGRNYLKGLLEKTDRSSFNIVVYCISDNIEDLKGLQAKYPEFILVSDFEPEGNPMNIIYDAQATPTCFMIDSKGFIRIITEGLNPMRFDEFLESEGCLK